MVGTHFTWGWQFQRCVWWQNLTAECASLLTWPRGESCLLVYLIFWRGNSQCGSEIPWISILTELCILQGYYPSFYYISGILRNLYQTPVMPFLFPLFSCEQSKRKADILLKDFIAVHINKLLIGHLAKKSRNLCKSQWDHLKLQILLFMSEVYVFLGLDSY